MTPTATRTNQTETAGLLARLRELVPRRGLSPAEARQIAERQAAILLASTDVTGPAVPDELVTDLPFVSVTRRKEFPTSGMATETRSGWVIVVRADEAQVRQRFSMVHELKHVLDDPFIEWMYPTKHGQSPEDRAERICDYFAACVLMPKMWVKRDWAGGGIQDIAKLARRYRVSQVAMAVRLSELHLLPSTPRCAGTTRKGDGL